MPIYEYKCSKCGNEFELLVSFSSTRKPQCPECKSEDVKKMISMIASGKSGCDSCASHSHSCSTSG